MNTIAAAVAMPPKPNGAKGCQLDGLTNHTAVRMKKRITPTFTITIPRLTRALSLMPMTSSQVSSPTTRMAGRLTSPGGSDHGDATSIRGMAIPNGRTTLSRRLTRYADQPIETRLAPTMYSRMRSQPITQATSSPRVA